jgi:hypothetical protein
VAGVSWLVASAEKEDGVRSTGGLCGSLGGRRSRETGEGTPPEGGAALAAACSITRDTKEAESGGDVGVWVGRR